VHACCNPFYTLSPKGRAILLPFDKLTGRAEKGLSAGGKPVRAELVEARTTLSKHSETRKKRRGVRAGQPCPKRELFAASFSLLFLHFCPTALDGAVTAFGNNHLRATFAAKVHLPELIGHGSFLLS
jgi:hypothetical protein